MSDGDYKIHNVSRVDIQRRQQELDSMIEQEPSTLDLEFGDPCYDGYHEPACPMTLFGLPYKLDIARRAREQKEAHAYLDMFKICMINPSRANHYKLLEGIAQDKSLIYDNK